MTVVNFSNKAPMSSNTETVSSADMMAGLLERVGEHQDRAAFAQLFDHFAPMIKRFCLSKGGSPALADELVQEAMLKIWTKAASYDASKAAPSTWIFTIVRNCRIDLFRQQSRHTKVLDTEDIWEEPESSEATPVQRLETSRIETAVRQSLDTLPKEQSEVLAKVFMEGMSHSEAAEALSLPLGTVKSRVRLAFRKLQPMLDR